MKMIKRDMDFHNFSIESTEVLRKKVIPYKKLVVPIRMRSVYWKYFGFPANEDGTILTKEKIVCVLCKSQMIYNRNTSNLRMHLSSRHKNIIQKIDPSSINEVSKIKKNKSKNVISRGVDENINFCNVEVMGLTAKKENTQDLQVVVSEENSETDISNIAIIFPQNEDLMEISQPKDIEDIMESNEISDSLVNFIINDLVPPDIVDGKGFHRFMSNLSNKAVVIPNEKKLVNSIIPTLFNTCKEQLYNSIVTTCITNISLSIEEWFSVDKAKCLSIYMHYLQKGNATLFTRLLITVICTGSESVDYWCSLLNHLFEEWSINSNAVTAVLVSFSNDQLKEALLNKNIILLPCFLFMIQELCSKHCFSHPELSVIFEKCRRLVKYIRDNRIELTEDYSFDQDEEDEDFIDYTLTLDRPEVWLTTYFMLKSLIRKKDSINNEMMNREIESIGIALNSDEWKNIFDLICLLEPLKTIVITLFEEKNSLISLLKPLIWKVNSSKFDINDDDSALIRELKINIKDVLGKAYTDENADNLTQIATIMDPRFKTFMQQDTYNIDNTLEDLLTHFVKFEVSLSPNESQIEEKNISTKKYGRTSGINVLFGNFCINSPNLSQEEKIKMEVSHYRNESTALLEECPLEWWQHMNNKCPNLIKLAYKYHCVPAIVTRNSNYTIQDYLKFYEKRAALNVNIADQLLFLYFNKNVL